MKQNYLLWKAIPVDPRSLGQASSSSLHMCTSSNHLPASVWPASLLVCECLLNSSKGSLTYILPRPQHVYKSDQILLNKGSKNKEGEDQGNGPH